MHLRLCPYSLMVTSVLFNAGAADVALAQPRDDFGRAPRHSRRAREPEKKGLILNTPAASPGYTLFAPLNSTTTFLVDMQGNVAHQWKSSFTPGHAVYLLDDGTLLRTAREPRNRHFEGGGIGGRVDRLAPDGTVLWSYIRADDKQCLHHDIGPLPSGNILMIAWEKKTREEAIAAGRDPALITGDELWPDCVIEIKPEGREGGKIVWEWHLWDHLIQDRDRNKPNYGKVSAHPELVDINYQDRGPRPPPGENRRLRALGYLGGGEEDAPPRETHPVMQDRPRERPNRGDSDPSRGPRDRRGPRGPGGMGRGADWCHTNSIAYNEKLDQIALSIHNFNEVWIIDHSTTTAEAASHKGGRSGKGGDLLYRWGNPRAYGMGGANDQRLFAQHDLRWIPDGFPGAGHLTAFNNQVRGPSGQYSAIVEFVPPMNSNGRYTRSPGKAFGPVKPAWQYTAPNKPDFYSSHISGAHRLPNGNTLICDGESSRIFEVTKSGKVVWDYINPHTGDRGPRDMDDGPRNTHRQPRDDGDADMDEDSHPPTLDEDDMPAPAQARPDNQDDDPPPPDDDRPPRGERRPREFRGPGGPGGPRGPGGPGGIFRATRLPTDHPGIAKLGLKPVATR